MEPIPGRPSLRDTKSQDSEQTSSDRCGPKPPTPTYYSSPEERRRYQDWLECINGS